MSSISYKHHRLPPEIIRHAVWLYHRFALSVRDVEDLPSERGITVSYECPPPLIGPVSMLVTKALFK
jgi:transposase-like protein